MADDVVNVLFVSAGNSSRSIMAEALLSKLGRTGFKVFSAGSTPVGSINALTLETLKQTGYDTSTLRSKSWNEFATIQAPRVDAVITLDNGEIKDRFPIWFSDPVIVHWDFAKVDGTQTDPTERQYAYRRLFGEMEQQILKLMGQDVTKLRGASLESRLKQIAP